ncbi:MAG: hypothetical protein AB7E49_08730 [Campylobacterales bacterium]
MGRMVQIAVFGVVLILSIAGCDDRDSEQAVEYERQLALNEKNYDKVLSMTAGCVGGTDYACLMDRAAAYAGKAGFTLSSVITGLTDDGGTDEFYEKLAGSISSSSTASDDLNRSKATYENIIEVVGTKDLVCQKHSSEYNASGYYQKAACFPHGMTVMARTAVLMDKMQNVGDDNATDAAAVADLLNNDIVTLVNLFGDGSAETVSAVNEIKDEICIAAAQPAGCVLTGPYVEAYLATH